MHLQEITEPKYLIPCEVKLRNERLQGTRKVWKKPVRNRKSRCVLKMS